jgi:hypothetical protein
VKLTTQLHLEYTPASIIISPSDTRSVKGNAITPRAFLRYSNDISI